MKTKSITFAVLLFLLTSTSYSDACKPGSTEGCIANPPNYPVKVETQAAIDDHGNSFKTATELILNSSFAIAGMIGTDVQAGMGNLAYDKEDFFKIALEKDKEYRLKFRTHAGLANVSVHDANKNTILLIPEAQRINKVIHTTSTGTHYIKVSKKSKNRLNYELKIQEVSNFNSPGLE